MSWFVFLLMSVSLWFYISYNKEISLKHQFRVQFTHVFCAILTVWQSSSEVSWIHSKTFICCRVKNRLRTSPVNKKDEMISISSHCTCISFTTTIMFFMTCNWKIKAMVNINRMRSSWSNKEDILKTMGLLLLYVCLIIFRSYIYVAISREHKNARYFHYFSRYEHDHSIYD